MEAEEIYDPRKEGRKGSVLSGGAREGAAPGKKALGESTTLLSPELQATTQVKYTGPQLQILKLTRPPPFFGPHIPPHRLATQMIWAATDRAADGSRPSGEKSNKRPSIPSSLPVPLNHLHESNNQNGEERSLYGQRAASNISSKTIEQCELLALEAAKYHAFSKRISSTDPTSIKRSKWEIELLSQPASNKNHSRRRARPRSQASLPTSPSSSSSITTLPPIIPPPKTLAWGYPHGFPPPAQSEAGRGGGQQSSKKKNLSTSNTLLEKESPRSVHILRSLLVTFLDEHYGNHSFVLKRQIDLARYSELSGQRISNVVVHETCTMWPNLLSLNLTRCFEIEDVGLSAIAQYCTDIQELCLSGCTKITDVGLRAISMGCQNTLKSLDLSDCSQIEEPAMKPLAQLKHLNSLSFNNCSGINDAGLIRLLGCLVHLTHLNISYCSNLKNVKDSIIVRCGMSCPKLEVLKAWQLNNSIRCRGIRCLATKGEDSHIRVLRLSPCDGIGSSTWRTLSHLGHSLTTLQVTGARNVRTPDLVILFSSLPHLIDLEFSACDEVNTSVIQALVNTSQKLQILDLHGCPGVNDHGLRAIARLSASLRNLLIADCPAVTPEAMNTLTRQWKSLRKLDITGNLNISIPSLEEICSRWHYLMVVNEAWRGLQRRPDANSLKEDKDRFAKVVCIVIRLLKLTKAITARIRKKMKRRAYAISYKLPKCQARIRGYLARVHYRELKEELKAHAAAKLLQAVWRGWRVRVEWAEEYQRRRDEEQLVEVTRFVQRVYRGFKGRKMMQKWRDTLAQEMLHQAQAQAAFEVYANKIQKTYRAHHARKEAKEMKRAKLEALAYEARRERGAVAMQQVIRGRKGRRKAQHFRDERIRHILEWQSARRLQTQWRVRMAKKKVHRRRHEVEDRRRLEAVMLIQRSWRGGRGRYFAMLQLKLAKLRTKEGRAATMIEKSFRGARVRKKVRGLRKDQAEDEFQASGVVKIQKVFRGHKGREAAEVEQVMAVTRAQGRPLFEKRALLVAEVDQAQKDEQSFDSRLTMLKDDIEAFDLELNVVNATSQLWMDSSRIHGMPQRYQTKYLRIQLQLERKRQDKILARLVDRKEMASQARGDAERRLRLVDRELAPFIAGVEDRTRFQRSKRLRDRVRLESKCAQIIQARYRGWRLRKAMFSWYRDYWVEAIDETTDSIYYFNTWSQETHWTRPYEMIVSLLMQEISESRAALPRGFVRKQDAKLKLAYFYNSEKHEYRWETPWQQTNANNGGLEGGGGGRGNGANGGQSSSGGSSSPSGQSIKVYDGAWFDRQNKHSLAGRSKKTRIIGYWEERRDPETGVTFYVHPITEEARWSLSPRSALADQIPLGAQHPLHYELTPAPASDWVKIVTEQGEVYYYSKARGASHRTTSWTNRSE